MATEAPNTLRSRARFKIIDIISEGPIKGLANGSQSIYLDQTPALSSNNTRNFPRFDPLTSVVELPIADITGVVTPEHVARFPSSENEVSVGVKIEKASPVTRTVSDASVDSVRLTLRTPALTTQNLTTGDITGGTIQFKIMVKPNGGDYRPIRASSSRIPLATVGSETSANAVGVWVTASITGVANQPRAVAYQYRKKTGGVWGDWITFKTWAQDASAFSGSTFTITNKIDGLNPGIYQGRAILSSGSGTVTVTEVSESIAGIITITGKTVSPYDASYEVELPDGGAPWDIRVERVSDDSPSSNIANDLFWLSYTEMLEHKFSWPNVAGFEMMVDAEDFGGNVPERAYDVMGLLVKIPTNYDPYARTYSGIWDGTFKSDWTDNPAWIFYDLLTNKRYGLGDNIEEAQIDKFGLYQIAQYCDQLVDGPDSTQEPRYTCNLVINSQAQAYEVLTAIASVFRGMIYWSGGKIVPVADMPKDPTVIVGPANVIDGMFNYQGAARKARHSVARVSWNNPNDGYKLNVELYEDETAIRKYGYNPIDVNAYGCTSRGLARRWAKWAISADNDVPDIVTYQASFDHHAVRPGDVVAIADPNYSGEELFGRIVDIVDNEDTTHTITLDREVVRIGGDESELQLVSADGDPILIDVSVISTTTSDEIIVDSTELAAMPIIGSTWLLKKETVEPRLWRVFSVVESDKNIFQVSAAQYDPNLYDKVESDLNFAEADFTAFPSGEMPAPVSLQTSEFLKQSGSSIVTAVTFSWTRPNDPRAERFEVQFRLSDEDWQTATPNITELTSIDILNTIPADYDFRVRAIDTSGLFRSEWATITGITLLGKDKPPEDVTGFTAEVEKYGVLMNWSPVSDIDIDYYEIKRGASWAAGTHVADVKATVYKWEDAVEANYTFWIKAVDTNGNESVNATSATALVAVEATPTVVGTTVKGGIAVEISGATTSRFAHYELQRKKTTDSDAQAVTVNALLASREFTDTLVAALGYVPLYQYRARAINKNLNPSAYSAWSTGVNPGQIESADLINGALNRSELFQAGVVDATAIGNAAVTAVKTDLAAINATNGQLNTDAVTALTIAAGAVEEAKIAVGAVNTAQINNAALKLPEGPVARWTAKGATTASIAEVDGVRDVSGNGNHGRAFGGVAIVDSEVGKAFSFDGTGYIEFGVFDTPDGFTLAGLVDVGADKTSNQYIIGDWAASGNRQKLVRIISNRIEGIVNDSGTVKIISASIPENRTYHYALTFDGEVLSIYLDGLFVESTGVTALNSATFPLVMGARSSDKIEKLTGATASTRIYPRALTAAEIKTLYMLGTDTESGTITADRVVTGLLRSSNWATDKGSEFDLDNGRLRLGGSSSPAFDFDAANNSGKITNFNFGTSTLISERNYDTWSSSFVLATDYISTLFGTRPPQILMQHREGAAPPVVMGVVRLGVGPELAGDEEEDAPIYSGVSSTSYYGVYTNARMYAGGGYYPTSDETVKSDISDVSVLSRLKGLPVKRFCLDEQKIISRRREKEFEKNIKNSNAVICETTAPEQPEIEYKKQRRIGTMAADFNRIFGTCAGETETFDLTDAIGVALRAIQELSAIVDVQKATIKDLCEKLHIAEPAYPVEPEYYLTREEQELIDLADKQTPEQHEHFLKVMKDIEEMENKKK